MDSSQNSCQQVKVRSSGGSGGSASEGRPMEVEESQYDKYVLQDPPWLVTANADDKVMLTYQMPSRWVGGDRREAARNVPWNMRKLSVNAYLGQFGIFEGVGLGEG